MLRRFRKDIDGLKVKIVRWFCSTNLTIKQFQPSNNKKAIYPKVNGFNNFIELLIP